MTSDELQVDKGAKAEEVLRSYFLSQGYYVVRGVPFTYQGFDVTDIDLWLYLRPSSLTRERCCVDVKRKKTPQAIERVFWTKGLREVLGLDRAIVVTTDNRTAVRNFGAANDVTVLHGEFLQRLVRASNRFPQRISEEVFALQLRENCLQDNSVNWQRFLKETKAILIGALDFDGCNQLLVKLHFLLDEHRISHEKSGAALRLLYVTASYFLIAVDYASRLITHLESDSRMASLADGFRYGSAGKERAESAVEMALKLSAGYDNPDLFVRGKIEEEVKYQLSAYPAEILAEYFAKPEVAKSIFATALEFDTNAFASSSVSPRECSPSCKSIVGLLCDFFKIDRKEII
jgi:hypothetical protein